MAVEPSNPNSPSNSVRVGHSIVDVLRRYWWFVALVVLVALGATFIVTKQQTETYSASARVLLRTNDTEALFPLAATAPEALIRSPSTEQFYAESAAFVATVNDLTPPETRVSARATESELVFNARGPSPENVAAAANLWAERYVQERHDAFVAEQEQGIEFAQRTIDDLAATRDELRTELDELETTIENTTDPDQMSRLLLQRVTLESALQSQLTPVDQQIASFRRQVADFELVLRFLESDEVSALVSREARVPSSPVSPNLFRNLVVGGMLGLALGVALPYLGFSFSESVDDTDDVAEATGLPVLSVIPAFEHESDQTIEALDHPNSPASEHYQALLTAIEFAPLAQSARSIFFTSAAPGEGKTTTAVNVAALAASFQNVLVIDADMRRPSMHKITGVPNSIGLSDVLAGQVPFQKARVRFERAGTRFDVLTAGTAVNDPALLLRGSAWQELLEQLFLYDLVIVDGPPVLAVTDALLIGRRVDAQVLLVRWGVTKRKALAAASDLLNTNGSRSLGVVVNRQSAGQSESYKYYGTYRSEPVPN